MTIIGVYPISNAISLNLYDLAMLDDEVLVGYNDEKPKWRKLKYDRMGEAYFTSGGRIYLKDFQLV